MIKKIFLIAGESSGDLLGSMIIKEFKKHINLDNDKEFIFSGIGGQLMQNQNFTSIFPIEDLSVMGIFEVIPHIPKLINRINFTVKKIIEFQPDYVVTIDSPDFCFRVIKKLQKYSNFKNYKKIHLIAPSVWAYRENRAKKISKLYDLLLAILPFEPPYFEKYGLKTKFIGHPIVEENPDFSNKEKLKSQFLESYKINKNHFIILLTPGSRIGEVKKIFPEFIKAVNLLKNDFDNFSVLIPVVRKTYEVVNQLAHTIEVPYRIIESQHKKLILMSADYAIAKSGTNSIEISLYKIPQIIAYKINYFTYQILSRIIKIKYANLLNIILNRELIPELLQDKCDPRIIHDELLKLIKDKKLAQKQINDSQQALNILGLGAADSPIKVAVNEIINL